VGDKDATGLQSREEGQQIEERPATDLQRRDEEGD